MSKLCIVAGLGLFVFSTAYPNLDQNLHCDEWASTNNECANNPRYMWSSCLTSCAKYAVNTDEDCDSFANEGECTNNPQFNHLNCPHSCGMAVAWNPWVRGNLEIDSAPFSAEVSIESSCNAPNDLFAAAEVMKSRVVKYMNGGHNSVKGLVSTAPTEFLGKLCCS